MNRCEQLTMADVISRNAFIYKNRTAIIQDDVKLTYGDVYRDAAKLVTYFRDNGLEPGARVGAHSENVYRMYLVLMACALGGYCYTPLNTRHSYREMSFMFEDSGVSAFVVQNPEFDLLDNFEKDFDFKFKLAFGDRDGWDNFDKVLASYPDDIEIDSTDVTGDTLMTIIYTAAVDGRPRGAMLNHRSFTNQAAQTQIVMGLNADDIFGSFLPLYHIFGVSLSSTIFNLGGCVYQQETFDAAAVSEAVAEHGVTAFAQFAPMGGRILEYQEQNNTDFSSLRFMFGMDTPDNLKIWQDRFGLQIYGGFGQAETNALAIMGPVDDPEKQMGLCGKPAPLTQVKLFDDDDNEVPVGTPGEICTRGGGTFAGYWNRDEVNKKVMRKGWHHTGDLGVYDEDGNLWFRGRKPEKDLIKPGGENVYPTEVENVLESHDAVEKAVVYGVRDAKWGEAVRAAVKLVPGKTATDEELILYCKENMASYKKPTKVSFVEGDFPKTSDGEIDKKEVAKTYA